MFAKKTLEIEYNNNDYLDKINIILNEKRMLDRITLLSSFQEINFLSDKTYLYCFKGLGVNIKVS